MSHEDEYGHAVQKAVSAIADIPPGPRSRFLVKNIKDAIDKIENRTDVEGALTTLRAIPIGAVGIKKARENY